MSSEHVAGDDAVAVQRRFMLWAESQGVRLAGVRAANIDGCGIGIVAEREISAGEVVAEVPAKALLTIHSISAEIQCLCTNCSAHGLLACFLALDGPSIHKYKEWRDTWPSRSDFEAMMPVMWPEACTKALPVSARVLLDRQKSRFVEDWRSVEMAFPSLDERQYTYFWLVVNTRSFYFEVEASNLATQDYNLVLCPFLDFFNHQDRGCAVAFDRDGYVVTAQKSYSVGEEVSTCYGPHSCDSLLIDYGFTLQSNQWDNVQIDHLLGQVIRSDREKTMLETAGYLGDYFLTSYGVCHRTQVAVRLHTLNMDRWTDFVAGTLTENLREQVLADEVIARVLLSLHEEAINMISHLQTTQNALPGLPYRMLINRWNQIESMITKVVHEDLHPQVRQQFSEQFGLPQ